MDGRSRLTTVAVKDIEKLYKALERQATTNAGWCRHSEGRGARGLFLLGLLASFPLKALHQFAYRVLDFLRVFVERLVAPRFALLAVAIVVGLGILVSPQSKVESPTMPPSHRATQRVNAFIINPGVGMWPLLLCGKLERNRFGDLVELFQPVSVQGESMTDESDNQTSEHSSKDASQKRSGLFGIDPIKHWLAYILGCAAGWVLFYVSRHFLKRQKEATLNEIINAAIAATDIQQDEVDNLLSEVRSIDGGISTAVWADYLEPSYAELWPKLSIELRLVFVLYAWQNMLANTSLYEAD